jgi:hypothetical protein
MSPTLYWELSDVSANNAFAILRVNIHPDDGNYIVVRMKVLTP